MLLKMSDSCLLIVDIQQKLTPFTHESEILIKNCRWICEVAKEFNIPTLISEQYPKGLGRTIPELLEVFPEVPVMDKVHFSCGADFGCIQQINATQKKQIVLIGIEAHVCVLQTALSLLEMGKQVFVVVDAISSRNPHDKKIAIKRMWKHGVELMTREMVFFEWMHQAGTEQFKKMSKQFL
ncbi:MAG: hydrolase [Proteobacteria bacterium]|nr:hydrolase [Pseudomonadota bacterium]